MEGLHPQAWDTHIHIVDSSVQPFIKDRDYTPPNATLEDWDAHSSPLAQDKKPVNAVIVAPSFYGTDPTMLIYSLRQIRERGDTPRGVAVVDVGTISDTELDRLHEAGVRGIRLNLNMANKLPPEEARKLLQLAISRIASYNPDWHVQLWCGAHIYEALEETILNSQVMIVADHLAGLKAPSLLPSGDAVKNQPGLQSVLRLVSAGKLWVKLSGFYQCSTSEADDWADVESIVQHLLSANVDQLVYGSDWPHPGFSSRSKSTSIENVMPYRIINDAKIIQNIKEWAGSERWHKISVENPRHLYRVA